MIIKKVWLQVSTNNAWREWKREGWYLFGVIPLYIRDVDERERRR